MIAFIEGGMKLPMGNMTRDYQCTPNLFRILGSVDIFSKQMELNLT